MTDPAPFIGEALAIFAQARAEAEERHRESVDFATRGDWWTDFMAAAEAYQPQRDPALSDTAAAHMAGNLYSPDEDADILMKRAKIFSSGLRSHLSGICRSLTDARLIDMTADAYRALHDYIVDHLMPIHNRLMDIYASRPEDAE